MDGNILLSLGLGVGLAAAVGFRVFVPLLILGLAVREHIMPASSGFEWVSSDQALLMLGVAAVIEIVAYYVPLLDNALDAISGPLAVVAGIGVTALALGDAPPMLKWTLAIIAGGGAAAATKSATTLLRGHSTALTAGLGNHVLTTGEIVTAVVLSLLSFLVPYLILVAAVLLAFFLVRRLWFKLRSAKS